MDSKAALERAVCIAKGQSALKRLIQGLGREVSQQSISAWLRLGRLPDGKDWGIWISRAIDYQVTPHELDKATYPNPWDGLPIELARPLMDERVAA